MISNCLFIHRFICGCVPAADRIALLSSLALSMLCQQVLSYSCETALRHIALSVVLLPALRCSVIWLDLITGIVIFSVYVLTYVYFDIQPCGFNDISGKLFFIRVPLCFSNSCKRHCVSFEERGIRFYDTPLEFVCRQLFSL